MYGIFVGWGAGRLGEELAGCLVGRLAGWLVGWLAGWRPSAFLNFSLNLPNLSKY
ncbi:hypothetical protein [Campylobacter concisus]|uniref:hypothetical protein n=1 Tax=Campylobacter concisus TaxID=199 RepID=UPI0021562C8C|nr:hypothetical protein [Campylobacter concisus]